MNHAQLQAEVVKICQRHGLLYFTWPQPWMTASGWLDMVIIGDCSVRFVELKTRRQPKRSPAQRDTARRLLAAGLAYRLWNEDDLAGGIIEADLACVTALAAAAAATAGATTSITGAAAAARPACAGGGGRGAGGPGAAAAATTAGRRRSPGTAPTPAGMRS